MNRQSAAAVIDAARFNRTHWLILGWGCFIMLFDGYDMVIYGSVVPRLMQEWQLSPVQAGTLGSCALFGMLFCSSAAPCWRRWRTVSAGAAW